MYYFEALFLYLNSSIYFLILSLPVLFIILLVKCILVNADAYLSPSLLGKNLIGPPNIFAICNIE